MSSRRIHIFISHSWHYSGYYVTLAEWIFDEKWSVGQASLKLVDYSIPKDNPIHNASTDKALEQTIYNHISPSHVIVIPTGMYTQYSKWIKKEINGAKYYKKPILAVNPWGQERTSSIVVNNATSRAGWNKKSVVDGIRGLYQTR